MADLPDRCRNRWREILSAFGVDARTLRNRHGPCPACGGEDRFRFDDKEGRGTFFCNIFGAGDGFKLLEHAHGWDFAEACRRVEEVIGECARDNRPKHKLTEAGRRSILRRAYALTRELGPGQAAHDYLASRLPGMIPEGLHRLRASDSMPRSWRFADGRPLDDGGPCLVAVVTTATDRMATLHRTYFGEGRERLLMPGSYEPGSAVRLMDFGTELGVAEGIETALAASWLFGVPVWAALNANGVREFKFPPRARRRLVFGDNDPKFAGQSAAYECARRAAGSRDAPAVECHIPDSVGKDWLDVALEKRGA